LSKKLIPSSVFSAVAICGDEPSTQNRSAAVDTSKAMKQNVHGPLSNDSRDGLLPQLEAYALPSGEAFLLQCLVLIGTAPGLLHCDVVQLTMNMKDICVH